MRKKTKGTERASPTRQHLQQCTICYKLPTSFYRFAIIVIYDVVLLLRVVSLMAGSTNGVPMSPLYGVYLTTSPSPYYTQRTQQPVVAPPRLQSITP